jgi:hypothetical protein
MSPRKIETALARFTLGALVIYFPAETYFSWSRGLTSPFYLVDLIAMILMLWGALHSLRARPQCAPAILCGAYGWAASNGWRATFGRVSELGAGGKLDFGVCELWCVGGASALALACFVITLVLVARSSAGRMP